MAKKRKMSEDFALLLKISMDEVLFECLDILKGNSKMRLTSNGKITEVYPVPVFSKIQGGGFYIKGVVYEPFQSVVLPEPIFQRLIYWEDLATTAPEVLKGRPLKYTSEEIQEWVRLKQSGLKLMAISELTGVKQVIISKQIKRYVEGRG